MPTREVKVTTGSLPNTMPGRRVPTTRPMATGPITVNGTRRTTKIPASSRMEAPSSRSNCPSPPAARSAVRSTWNLMAAATTNGISTTKVIRSIRTRTTPDTAGPSYTSRNHGRPTSWMMCMVRPTTAIYSSGITPHQHVRSVGVAVTVSFIFQIKEAHERTGHKTRADFGPRCEVVCRFSTVISMAQAI